MFKRSLDSRTYKPYALDLVKAGSCARQDNRHTNDDGMWTCRYEIDWPSQKRSHFAGGIDSFQALILALQMIGAEIYASTYHKAGSLKWFERYRGYGFPVGCNLRDLLIGDDTNM